MVFRFSRLLEETVKQAFGGAAALALVLAASGSAQATTIALTDSGRGWCGVGLDCNGNDVNNNYIAGSDVKDVPRDHFDFAIPVLSETLTGATLSLDNPEHDGGTNTFTVSSLGAFGSYGHAGIGSGTTYGAVHISASGTVTISLDAAALTDILGKQGATFSLGALDSGELLFPLDEADFASTGVDDSSTLTLTTAATSAVPEPATLSLLGLGLAGIGAFRRRSKR